MRLKLKLSPINPRETAEQLDALGGALAQINASQLGAVDGSPCCGPCAGVALVSDDDAIKDAAALIRDGHGGPLSLVCLAAGKDVSRGHEIKIRHERHGNGVRPVYYRSDGKRIDPLAVYAGRACACGKRGGKK